MGPIDVLLVEDNPGDVRLMKEVLDHGRLHKRLAIANDGAEAMDFLRRRGQYHDAFRPDLVLLDLNLPKKDGRQVLSEIRGDPDLERIPVVILTSSSAGSDILNSYTLHANCYVTKPFELDDYVLALNKIKTFWLNFVKLPPQ